MGPLRDFRKILVVGAGPIKIGQACEFDYSGTQACKALLDEGFEVVLVNSNPATIMTDPDFSSRTYIEPLTADCIEKVIVREKPDALLPTMGGQTALNVAVSLAESGALERHGVRLIGASLQAIKIAEDRELFRSRMLEIGVPVPRSVTVTDIADLGLVKLSLPIVVRPAFTLGGTGSGLARSFDELRDSCLRGLAASPVKQVLLEEYLGGWKEIELEVMRDRLDNFIVVCAIENFDPMGIHTGDSITVAPLQTISDKEYQVLRNAARMIVRATGIECGGSNVQFAINPSTGEYRAIEINPRVSRSSALASKATGYPIAKVAAKLAVGLTLDEIRNDIAASISACFEPSLDYVITKIPRFDFDRFTSSSGRLGTEMKSVGEVMALGATFQESVQKAVRSLDVSLSGLTDIPTRTTSDQAVWKDRMSTPSRYRLSDVWSALGAGVPTEEISSLSGIDRWFVDNLAELRQVYEQSSLELKHARQDGGRDRDGVISESWLRRLKRCGFSDRQIAHMIACAGMGPCSEEDVFDIRQTLKMVPVFRAVDTCAAEFASNTSYLYSTYESHEQERVPSNRQKVIVLGSGPNRIGQGIEFDYCCVQASLTLRQLGFESIMVNCNPETVSTDYDVSDVLYFEPVTLEDVSNIMLAERPIGVIVQFGGQTPLNLAGRLKARGFHVLGTDSESSDVAEDRERFSALLRSLGLRQPAGATVSSLQEATTVADLLGYPVLVRPSFVLGGRAMQMVHSHDELVALLRTAFMIGSDRPVLIDQFLSDALEVDVDAVSDGTTTVIAGVMEHIEHAGVHSGDSSCVLPPRSLPHQVIAELTAATLKIAEALGTVGLLNVQFAVKSEQVYVLEANPRASRTIPFVSKATGVPWVKIATRVIMGERLNGMTPVWNHRSKHVAVKSVVLPFSRFPGSTIGLGPEMRSTGEVMGIGDDFPTAYAKAQMAAERDLPVSGHVLVSFSPSEAGRALEAAHALAGAGLRILLAGGSHRTASELSSTFPGLSIDEVSSKDSIIEQLRAEDVAAVVSLTRIDEPREETNIVQKIRRAAITLRLPLFMTLPDVLAAAEAIGSLRGRALTVRSLQEYQETHRQAWPAVATPPVMNPV